MTFFLMSKGGVPHFLDSQFWLSTVKYSAFNSLERVTEYSSIRRHEKLSTELSFFRHEMRCEQAKGGRPRQVAISCMWEWKRRKNLPKKGFLDSFPCYEVFTYFAFWQQRKYNATSTNYKTAGLCVPPCVHYRIFSLRKYLT